MAKYFFNRIFLPPIIVTTKTTDSTKINRPGLQGITFTERIFDTVPDCTCTKIIFVKTVIEVCSPHSHASFGTFYAQIGQLFEAK